MTPPEEFEYWLRRHREQIADQAVRMQVLGKQLHIAINALGALCDTEEAAEALEQISNTGREVDGG